MRVALLVMAVAGCSTHSQPQQTDAPATSDAPAASDASDATTALQPLYPLRIGRSWTAAVDSVTTAAVHCTSTASVVGTSMVDGRAVFVLSSSYACDNSPTPISSTIYVAETGNHVEQRSDSDPTWIVSLDEPVEAGHSWIRLTTVNGPVPCQWEATGDATAPAGTFHDCWTVACTPTGQTLRSTYCRGVGYVLSNDDYGNGSTATGRLLSTSG